VKNIEIEAITEEFLTPTLTLKISMLSRFVSDFLNGGGQINYTENKYISSNNENVASRNHFGQPIRQLICQW